MRISANRSPGSTPLGATPRPLTRSLRPLEVPAGTRSTIVPLRRGDVDFGSERGLGQRHRNLHVQIISAAAEKRMSADADRDQNVAGRAAARGGRFALPAQADFLAVFDTDGDFDDDRFGLARSATDRKLHFAADDRGGEGDFDFGGQIGAAFRLAGGTAFASFLALPELAEDVGKPAGRFAAEAVAEESG